MSVTPPTHIPNVFDFWDNANKHSWQQLFATVCRGSQSIAVGTGCDIVNASGNELLRRSANIVSHSDFDARKAIQNMTDFKLGGAINIALNQDNKLGMIWNYRPIIPPSKVERYREIWRGCSKVREEKGTPIDRVKREVQYEAFLLRVMPLMGMWSLEFPRGHGAVTQTPAETSADEAEGELLVKLVSQDRLGFLGEDTANNPALNDFFVVRMDVHGKPSHPRDLYEKIAAKAVWLARWEFDQAVLDGHIVDPQSLAALEMCRIWSPHSYASII